MPPSLQMDRMSKSNPFGMLLPPKKKKIFFSKSFCFLPFPIHNTQLERHMMFAALDPSNVAECRRAVDTFTRKFTRKELPVSGYKVFKVIDDFMDFLIRFGPLKISSRSATGVVRVLTRFLRSFHKFYEGTDEEVARTKNLLTLGLVYGMNKWPSCDNPAALAPDPVAEDVLHVIRPMKVYSVDCLGCQELRSLLFQWLAGVCWTDALVRFVDAVFWATEQHEKKNVFFPFYVCARPGASRGFFLELHPSLHEIHAKNEQYRLQEPVRVFMWYLFSCEMPQGHVFVACHLSCP